MPTAYSAKSQMSLEERATMWAQQYKRSMEKRVKMKEQRDAEEMAECTFAPKTSSRGGGGSSTARSALTLNGDTTARSHKDAWTESHAERW